MKNSLKNIFPSKFFSSSLAITLLAPAVSFAALDGTKDLLRDFDGILKQVWVIVIALAFVYFFWGMGQFILHSGDQKVRDEGKQKMIWGIIALFLIVSIGGVIQFVGTLVGIDPNTSQFLP